MKKSTSARIAAGLSLMALTTVPAISAEYSLSAGLSAADLVDILVPSGSGITVIGGSETFTGAMGATTTTTAVGAFTGGSTVNPGPQSTTGLTGLPFDSGVIITTGTIANSRGTLASPNNSRLINKDWELGGSALLESTVPVAGAFGTRDAATLSFRFTPSSSLFLFQYAFGSDEFAEFVGTSFSDAFAFVLTDETTGSVVNLATIGGTPISVNTVNSGSNPTFYTDNTWVSTAGGSTYLIEYDGLAGGDGAKPLFAVGEVDEEHTYRIDLVIADVNDGEIDSAVFLKAASFVSHPSVPEPSTYIGALALVGLMAKRLRRK